MKDIVKCFSKGNILNSQNDSVEKDNFSWNKIFEIIKIFLFIIIAILLFAQIILFIQVNKKNEVIQYTINKINNSSDLNITINNLKLNSRKIRNKNINK